MGRKRTSLSEGDLVDNRPHETRQNRLSFPTDASHSFCLPVLEIPSALVAGAAALPVLASSFICPKAAVISWSLLSSLRIRIEKEA
jgi:hypothetical protein